MEVVIDNPELGPVHILKADVSDGFYRIGLRPTDTPLLGLVFTSKGEGKELVAIPITLPMGWKKLSPIYFHGNRDSVGSSKCSLALQYTQFTAKAG